jgi:hypothetical protein
VDDLRKCPEGWTVARTNTEAIRLLASGYVDEIVSIDHDICVPFSGELSEGVRKRLQVGQETFQPVAFYLSVMPAELRPKTIRFHTSNPDGAAKMMGVLKVAGIDSTYVPAGSNVDTGDDLQ